MNTMHDELKRLADDLARDKLFHGGVVQISEGLYFRILAALTARSDGWLDIASAPRDGTRVLLGHAGAVFSGWWTVFTDEGPGWVTGETNIYDDFVFYPATHWQPLPAPPERPPTE